MRGSRIVRFRRVLPVLLGLSLVMLVGSVSVVIYAFYRDTGFSFELLPYAIPTAAISAVLVRVFHSSAYGGLLSCPRCRRPLSGYFPGTFGYVPFSNPPCPHCGLEFRDEEGPVR